MPIQQNKRKHVTFFSFQTWFDFDTTGDDEVRERIIAQEREQHVLSTLHQVRMYLTAILRVGTSLENMELVFVQILTPFLLRRLKTDVEFSLPPKKEILVYAPLTFQQVRMHT